MGDDLGRGERPEPAARGQIEAAAEPEQEAGRVEIAGAGGIDQHVDRVGVDDVHVVPPTTMEPRALRVSAATSQ